MMDVQGWNQLFDVKEKRFLVWSKSNQVWTTFYRTTRAGHWDKDDVEEFGRCIYAYEIHLNHGNDDAAHLFCLRLMERCPNFKAAKVSKLAVNDMKVILLLAKKKSFRDKVQHAARQYGFQLARIRDQHSQKTQHEIMAHSMIGQQLDALGKALAPNLGIRAKRP